MARGASWPGPRPNAHHSLSRARTRDRASVRTRRGTVARRSSVHASRNCLAIAIRTSQTDARRDLRPHGRRAMAWAIHALSRPGPLGMQWALPLAALLCRCRSGGIRLVPGAPSLSHRVRARTGQEHRPSRRRRAGACRRLDGEEVLGSLKGRAGERLVAVGGAKTARAACAPALEREPRRLARPDDRSARLSAIGPRHPPPRRGRAPRRSA